MRAFFLLALIGFTLASPTPDRIVGGSDTTIETYPFTANMHYGLFGILWYHHCGGTLITENSILSAAHCFEGDAPSQWRAILGTSRIYTGGNVHNIARITSHPQHNVLTMDADVAILKLTTKAALSSTTATVSIASAGSQLTHGLPVTIIGWGDTLFQGSRSEQLQHAEVFIINQNICAQRYASLTTSPNITSGMACAGILDVGGRDRCNGDAGGPVLFRGTPNILVGVSSWGHQCALGYYPGVMARVPTYSNWILANAT